VSCERVRFAPSPTGELHVGNARTALFNWLHARARGGRFVLRIEDTDVARSQPEHEAGLLEDLRWLGLGWDEGIEVGGDHGPYRQSDRLALYAGSAERLIGRGMAYPCFCPDSLLEEERSEQRRAGQASVYSGRCRRIPPDEAARRRAGEEAAIRLNVVAASGGDASVVFNDLVHGTVRFPITQIGDAVLVRRGGWPSYNFAVVVDDLLMQITHVIRGDDHLSNTPRQLLLYRALEAPAVPAFAHLPLIVGPGGAPLSKRDGATSVGWFRDEGYPPEALLNYLALLGWSHPAGQELLTPEELIAGFDLARVSRAPAIFDRRKLDSLAARHMAKLPAGSLGDLAVGQLARAGRIRTPVPPRTRDWIGRVAMMYADRLPKMSDLTREIGLLLDFSPSRSLSDPEVRATIEDEAARGVIEALVASLGTEPLSAPRFQEIAEQVRRQTGAKGRGLYHPIRVALTGAASGPELVRLLPLIDEGSSLDLPDRVVPCAERARALLAAGRGSSG
jgi:glutamyl-tRNA synthetase